jgi:RNA-binding protein
MLTSKQRSNLRGLASKEEILMQVGKNGINENLIKSLSDALEKRELIKLRVLETSEDSPKEVGMDLASALNAEFVATTGKTIVLYRKSSRENIKHIEF